MNRPQSIPANYIETEPGVWVHPSRLPHTALKDAIGACEIHKQAANLRVAQVIPKPPKRIRQSTKPLLNKLESEFVEHMKMLYPSTKFYPQAIRFALGNGIAYKPDLVTFNWCDRQKVECWEVKGPHAFRGGFENLKVAARTYPDVVWRLVWKEKRQWQEQLVLP